MRCTDMAPPVLGCPMHSCRVVPRSAWARRRARGDGSSASMVVAGVRWAGSRLDDRRSRCLAVFTSPTSNRSSELSPLRRLGGTSGRGSRVSTIGCSPPMLLVPTLALSSDPPSPAVRCPGHSIVSGGSDRVSAPRIISRCGSDRAGWWGPGRAFAAIRIDPAGGGTRPCRRRSGQGYGKPRPGASGWPEGLAVPIAR
jgi:hypothetical protein